jgi:ribosomal protein S18 acetylase RimI-like enzyme
MNYRFLTPADLPQMRTTFNQAFADYFVESQLSEEQLANHLGTTAVRLELSVGAFSDGEMVGLLLNGVDVWGGLLTAYDAGTGIVPAHRGRGVSGEMFRFAVPKLKESGVQRCLLEVIKENEPAIKTYRELGFATTRELQCFKRPADPFPGAGISSAGSGSGRLALRIEEVRDPAWSLWSSFWDWQPSWQNSPGSVARLAGRATVLGASHKGACVGYVAFVPAGGRIMQIAVAPDLRRRGVGARLLRSVRAQVAADRDLTTINVDASAGGTLAFLRANGFVPTIGQYEMTLALG